MGLRGPGARVLKKAPKPRPSSRNRRAGELAAVHSMLPAIDVVVVVCELDEKKVPQLLILHEL